MKLRIRMRSAGARAPKLYGLAPRGLVLRGVVLLASVAWLLIPPSYSGDAARNGADHTQRADVEEIAGPTRVRTSIARENLAIVRGFVTGSGDDLALSPSSAGRHTVAATRTVPFTIAARGSSVSEVAFETAIADPFKVDLDSGWLPPAMPTQNKFYYYSSTGEMAVNLAGKMIASYDSAGAVPGCTLTVRVDPVGDPTKSTYSSDSGTRLGMRYRLNIDVGPVDLKAEDYVPFIPMPDLDFSYKCPETSLAPFSFDHPDTACVTQNGVLGFCAWSGGGLAQTCVTPTTITSFINLAIPCLPLPIYVDASSFSIGVPVKPLPIDLAVGAYFGRCALYTIETDRMTDKGASPQKEVDQDGEAFQYDVILPCYLAAATQGPREHQFDTGPYELDAGLFRAMLRRAEPTVGTCLVELFDFTLSSNLGYCVADPQSGNLLQSNLLFNDVEASHTIRIVDPVVRSISPSGGVVATDFVAPVAVTWQTSWGAPDKCGCQARVFYRLKSLVSGLWGPYTSVHPESSYVANSGGKDWQVPPTATCQEGQIKVELYDPQRKFLHEAVGDSFLVSPVPQVAVFEPMQGDSICVGDTTLIAWVFNMPSGCSLDPQAFDLRLLNSWGQTRTIALGLPPTPSPSAVLWNLPIGTKADSAARVIVDVRNQSGTVGRDTSATFAIVQPVAIIVQPPQNPFPIGQLPGFFGVELENDDLPSNMLPFGHCGSDGNFNIAFVYQPGGPLPLVTFVNDVDGNPYDLPGDYFVPGLEPQTATTFQFAMLPNDVGPPPDPGKATFGARRVSRRPGDDRLQVTQVDTFFITATSFGGFNPTVMDTLYIVPDSTATGIFQEPTPTRILLEPGYPNPFTPRTTIRYALPKALQVRLRVYDVAGRLVRVLVNGPKPAGRHQVHWNGRGSGERPLASGVYYYRLQAGEYVETRSIVLVR